MPLLKQRAAGDDERLDVYALDACAVGTAGIQAAVEDGLQGEAQREAVAGVHQVNGVAHQRDAHRAPVEDQAGQLVGVEPSNRVHRPT